MECTHGLIDYVILWDEGCDSIAWLLSTRPHHIRPSARTPERRHVIHLIRSTKAVQSNRKHKREYNHRGEEVLMPANLQINPCQHTCRTIKIPSSNMGDNELHVQYNFGGIRAATVRGQVAWNLTEPWLDINTIKVRRFYVRRIEKGRTETTTTIGNISEVPLNVLSRSLMVILSINNGQQKSF
jgi:hypothetical protein